jgi:hypothetical protein
MATKLIADIVEAPTIKLTSGAVDGYFLKTDSDGNATWTPISASQVYKGTWNADTNTPTLADSTGVQGHYYRVTTAGTSDLDDSRSSGKRSISYDVGDDVIHNGTFWERVPGVGYTLQTATDAVLGGVKIGNGVSISNGIISVSTDAETLNGLDSNDFVRSTGNTSQNVNGNKTFLNKALLPNQSGTKGAGTGSSNDSFYSFYESDGTTRQGFMGVVSTSNNDIGIVSDISGKKLVLKGDGVAEYDGDLKADAFFENSDKRLKTNIKKISKSVYSYELKSQLGITLYGTIAQEIEKTNPEVVKKSEDDGMMSVNYNSFLSLKLSEQENKTEDLQKQIDELKELIKNK